MVWNSKKSGKRWLWKRLRRLRKSHHRLDSLAIFWRDSLKQTKYIQEQGVPQEEFYKKIEIKTD